MQIWVICLQLSRLKSGPEKREKHEMKKRVVSFPAALRPTTPGLIRRLHTEWWRQGRPLMKNGFDWLEIWVKSGEWNGGNCGSRLKARVVDTRENERRDVGLLLVVARYQTSPKELAE